MSAFVEGGLHRHRADIIGLSIRNAVKLDLKNVTNSMKNEPSKLLILCERCV